MSAAPQNSPPLDKRSVALRRRIVEVMNAAGRGHLASAFSLVEILRVLYDSVLQFDPRDPALQGRDRFILSKGHGCLALYVILAEKGFFPVEELSKFCRFDSILGGHPEPRVPGVELEIQPVHPDVVQQHQRPEGGAGAARARRPFGLHGEHLAEVPAMVVLLAEDDRGMLDVRRAHDDAPVEDVTRVVGEPERAARDEERILGIGDVERVEPDVGEEGAAHAADVHASLHPRHELPLQLSPDPVAPALTLRGGDESADHRGADHEHQQRAVEHDELASGLHPRRPARSRR